MENQELWALYVGVASLAIGMLGVLGIWLCYLFQAVARGPPPAPPPPPPPCTPETEEDDKNGLSEEELRMLGGVCAAVAGDGEEEQLCPICLDGMEAGRAVRVLPGCSRAFHQDCVDRWLTISPRCPVCNTWVTPQSPGTSPPPAKPALDSEMAASPPPDHGFRDRWSCNRNRSTACCSCGVIELWSKFKC